jgi:hypothetical protein
MCVNQLQIGPQTTAALDFSTGRKRIHNKMLIESNQGRCTGDYQLTIPVAEWAHGHNMGMMVSRFSSTDGRLINAY